MNAKPKKQPDLKPLKLSDEELDALAGIEGFTPEQLGQAQAWGSERLKRLLDAQEEERGDANA